MMAERKPAVEKDAEKDAQRYLALGRFMLEMRHDMNNALTAVLGNSELLLETELPQQAREQLASVHAMAARIQEIMQQFAALDAEMRLAARAGEKSKYVSAK
jgi:signal transduction histidine kinase